MTPNTIRIDDVEYAPVTNTEPTEKRIVIAQRGWCFVGDYTEDGDDVTLSNASVIRTWGTTKGLGQLAADGPTSATKLDPCGTVRIHRLSIVATLDTDATW
jgi:hypothetical protein